jgi:hypothetical protein
VRSLSSELVTHELWWNSPGWLRLPLLIGLLSHLKPLNNRQKKKEISVYTSLPTIQLRSYLWNNLHLSYDLNVSQPGFVALLTTVIRTNKINKHLSTSRLQSWWHRKHTGFHSHNYKHLPPRSKLSRKINRCLIQVICFLYIPFSVHLVYFVLVVQVETLKYHIHSSIQWYFQESIPSLLFSFL